MKRMIPYKALKLLNVSILSTLLILPFTLAQAGQIKVVWNDFDEYTDVRPSNETKGSFHKRVKKYLEKYFAELEQQLPENYQLQLIIKDVDLAGDVRYGMQDLRIIKRIHFPKFNLDYKLLDANGNIVSQDSKRIKDMTFLDGIHSRSKDRINFYYEKKLLEDWFNKDLVAKL